jgi:hypothetical protein
MIIFREQMTAEEATIASQPNREHWTGSPVGEAPCPYGREFT